MSRSVSATRVAYGGVDLTVPHSWRILKRGPAFCGSRVGQVVYAFSAEHSPPAGGSCSSGAPIGPYVSVECEPFNPQPNGHVAKLGAISATELGTTTTSGLTNVFFYLKPQDAELEIYASPTTTGSIESSVATSHGHC